MKELKNRPTVSVEFSDMRLKVIRVGATPRLLGSAQDTPQRPRKVHSHFTYEIFFVTNGALTIVTEDSRTTYERTVVIIPPRIGHYTVSDCDGSFCLLFSFEKSKKGGDSMRSIQDVLNHGIYELPISEDIDYYMHAIARKSEENTPDAESDVVLLIRLVFGEILRLLLPKPEVKGVPSSESKHIAAIETYINANYSHRISLSDVAERVYLSTRQVSRILQAEYGCTLSQLVLKKRLAQAQMLLKNTELKMSQIAQRVGMGSENYFFSVFKKHYGITPLKYRKKHR